MFVCIPVCELHTDIITIVCIYELYKHMRVLAYIEQRIFMFVCIPLGFTIDKPCCHYYYYHYYNYYYHYYCHH